jgi:hypothetical protein
METNGKKVPCNVMNGPSLGPQYADFLGVVDSWQAHMCPAALALLVHCHELCDPIPESTVNSEIMKWFLAEGVVKECGDFGCGYTTTERGRKWMEMFLKTPMPEQKWVDPRDIAQ